MGAIFRWMRTLYRFFAAPTRRLVVFPLAAVPVTLVPGPAIGAAWAAAAAGDIVAAAAAVTRSIRIYGIDMTNPTGVAQDFEVRIGYGPTATPTWTGVVTYNLAGVTLPFPMEVPSGQALRAQCRSTVAGNTVDVKFLAYTID